MSSGCATWIGARALTGDGRDGTLSVSARFFMHEAHGAADTTGVLPDEKSEVAAPGRAIAKAATAAAEAAVAAEAERTKRRCSACVRSAEELTAHTSVESWITVDRTAISRVHPLHAGHSRR